MWLSTIGLGAGVSLALAYLEQHSEQQKLLKNLQPLLQGSFVRIHSHLFYMHLQAFTILRF